MKNKSELSGWLAGLLRNRLVLVGGCILVLLVLSALTAPLWVKAGLLRDPLQQFPTGFDEDGMPMKASGQFLAGTDNLGRDVFSRMVYGTRCRSQSGSRECSRRCSSGWWSE